MCGIVGFIDSALGEKNLERAVNALRHRGPDGTGFHFDSENALGLGHARLAIIDLETGAHPLYSETRDLALVANGEIYDFERIRAELTAKGHRFSTRGDSEVILHLYEEHGLDFVRHLRGEFAFLLYHRSAGILLAARDRFGVKPLLFSSVNGRYHFASEAKALFAMGALRPRIDVRTIRDQLSGVIPDSIFEGVNAVPPGCILKVDLGTATHSVIRYWDVDLGEAGAAPDLDKAVRTVRESVEEAVRLRMRADVPVGVYLSGGIDSAIVAALAARHQPDRLKAFTVSFPGNPAYDEAPLAKRMAEKIGAEFHSVECDDQALLENLEDTLRAVEQPFFNFHGVGKFLLSALARRHVNVVLTGEGSDETFLGYSFFQRREPAGRTKPQRAPHVRRFIEALGFDPPPETRILFSSPVQSLFSRLLAPPHRSSLKTSHPLDRMMKSLDRRQLDGLGWMRRLQYLWIKQRLTPYLLTMLGDRQEMAHSIEGRVPFLDHKLFEEARAIPDFLKIEGRREKHILREAFRTEVTEEIYTRKKWAYSAPPLWVEKGRSKTMDALIERHLSREAIERAGIFSVASIRLIQGLMKGFFIDCGPKRALNLLMVFILTTQALSRIFVEDFDEATAGG